MGLVVWSVLDRLRVWLQFKTVSDVASTCAIVYVSSDQRPGSQIPAHHVSQAGAEVGRSDQRQNRRSLSMMAVFGMLAVCHIGTLWFLLLQAQVCCDKDQDKCAKAFCADVSLRLAEIRLTQLRRYDGPTVRRSGRQEAANQQQVRQGDVRLREDIQAKMGCAGAIRRNLESGKDLSMLA